jgi:signal transduction histidine kinase
VTIIDKQKLSRIDNALMISFFLCCLFGFFINFKQPLWLAKFWFIMSCSTYIPIIYLPWYEEEALLNSVLAAVDSVVMKGLKNSMKTKRAYISIWLNIIFPLYTVNYVAAMCGYIDKPTTIAVFQILSVLTKGIFATLVMDFQKASSGELQKLADSAANESRRNFTKYIFHEVRSPLNSLVMGIEILQRSTNVDAMEQEILSGMKLAAAFMSNTLNDVLSLQKIEEGKLELETVVFDVTDVVNTVFATCKAAAQSKDISLVSDLAQNLPRSILGDRFKIEHVISNLLTNAIKFSPPNSTVTVRITSAAFDADPTTGARRVMIEIAVIDQGPGISAVNSARLFQSYVQIRPGALQKGQGSGLGLSICKEIVIAHGGTINVSSEEGKGSTFHFRVPFCIDESQTNAMPSVAAESLEDAADLAERFDHPNVLVVDGKPNCKNKSAPATT